MSQPRRRTEVRASWLQKVHEAELDFRVAFLEAQRVINEYYFMSPSDGDFALDKALKRQHEATDKFVAMCRLFTKSILASALPGKRGSGESPNQPQHNRSRARRKLKPLSKLEEAAERMRP